MITVKLHDPKLKENLEAIKELRDSGLFTDEQIQEMYDKQIEADKKEKDNA